MGWIVPDKGTGADLQSILFSEYLQVLQDGISGTHCVLAGCVVSPQGSPNMTVAVSKGAVLSAGVLRAVAASASLSITAANATHPRLDLVVVNSAGTLAVRTGTAAAAPKPPARTADDVVLAVVYVPANDTTIAGDQISDLRVLREVGPITIYKQTTADTVNTTAAAIEVLNRTNSGVTIPDGLFLAGRVLRVRAGGNMLLNSTTPTVRLIVSYGGTTMFSDISAASTNDTDRGPWSIDFDIAAQANNDQAMAGNFALPIIAAKTAPTTGIGDAWSTASNVNALAGAAAVDSNAANRLLSVSFTLSVSNAANEVVTEYATVELI